jgi:hypothetical protein
MAHIRTVSDCVVEAWNGDHAVVVTMQAAARGEQFVMQLTSPSGDPRPYAVCVVSSTPDVGTGRFRLHLTVGPVPAGWREYPVPQF